jgi:hypothetical protein
MSHFSKTASYESHSHTNRERGGGVEAGGGMRDREKTHQALFLSKRANCEAPPCLANFFLVYYLILLLELTPLLLYSKTHSAIFRRERVATHRLAPRQQQLRGRCS